MSMITAAPSSPRVRPLFGLPPSSTLTNIVPIIEAMIPMAAKNSGSSTAPNPPNFASSPKAKASLGNVAAPMNSAPSTMAPIMDPT